ncbi:hypothetical protein DM860_000545 [Cuscuta australis]|uniref:RRM domain-containing protein n=1 Tax=Cuscuta australis TaxID=267555 RepID=A0A328CZU8_9ASTE|nr:hypothetical protein DM860_000545 [Cuscuta australis]
MEHEEEEKYASFLKKVKRTVFVDNLSPMATKAVLTAAFNQFGRVTDVSLLPNYLNLCKAARSALVEMETAEQAESIISEVSSLPFMIAGMPRPVRAYAAQVEMFDERPPKPGLKLQYQWVDRGNPNYGLAMKMKALAQEHASQAEFLMEHQVEEEEKLAKKQEVTFKANYKKYQLLDSITGNGQNSIADQLARRYGLLK